VGLEGRTISSLTKPPEVCTLCVMYADRRGANDGKIDKRAKGALYQYYWMVTQGKCRVRVCKDERLKRKKTSTKIKKLQSATLVMLTVFVAQ